MEVEEVEDGRLHGVDEELVVEGVAGLRQAVFYPAEVAFAHEALVGVEAHYGVAEKGELPFHAVVSLRVALLYELCGGVESLHLEVGGRLYVIHQFSFAHYHEVAFA